MNNNFNTTNTDDILTSSIINTSKYPEARENESMNYDNMASIMDVLNKYPQSVILSNPNGSKILG
jgi:hypothetical protein